jgi:hypothetical protein
MASMGQIKKLFLAALFALGVGSFMAPNASAAAITPDTVRRATLGGFSLVIADFTAGTADDGDTWASGLTGVAFWFSSDNDNPTTQASVGVATAFSAGTFTFYPAEDNKPFTLYVLVRS